MTGKRLSSSLILVVALYAVFASASLAGDQSDPEWISTLHARSDALNRSSGLGSYAPAASTGSSSEWLSALSARSAALNARYHLGAYAQTTATPSRPAARAAATTPTSAGASGFDWADASIGAAGGVVVALTGAWLLLTFVGARQRGAGLPDRRRGEQV